MKLHDFLSNKSKSRPSPTRTVRFKVVGFDDRHERVVSDAVASLAFVDEAQRQEALQLANAELTKAYKDDPIPPDRRTDEESYHILQRALRDADDPRQPFAEDVRELKNGIVFKTLLHLLKDYFEFVEEEFPAAVDDEGFKGLINEAKKK